MYRCPACGRDGIAKRMRCFCGADLSLLAQLDSLCDAWFNSALEALAAGKPGRAIERLSACCTARPSDVSALCALAKTWAQLGHLDDATDALGRATAVQPDAPELAEIRRALDEARVPAEATDLNAT
jgi:cytochrome c-type biogenesis protein CcmH/NrfG